MLDRARLEKLCQALRAQGLDAFLTLNSEGRTLANLNPLYLTGLRSTNIWVLVLADSREMYLFTDGRYGEEVKTIFPEKYVHVVTTKVSDTFGVIKDLMPENCRRIGYESDVITEAAKNELIKSFSDDIELSPVTFENNPILKLRRAKSDHEKELMRQAQAVSANAILHALQYLKPGVTEMQIAEKIESYMKCQGALVGFPSIVASGIRSAFPHGRASEKVIEAGDSIQFDVGAVYKDYHGDISRFAFLGEPDPKLLQIFKSVRTASKYGTALCLPGMNCRAVHAYVDKFLQPDYGEMPHGLGHGIGLEEHEHFPHVSSGALENMKLEIGDMVTIEPGVYVPGLGGIRLEDLVYVGEIYPEVLAGDIIPVDEPLIVPV